MNLWKYYNGDLKYPDLNNHSHEIEIAKANPKWAFGYVLKHGENEDLEPIIAKDAKFSYYYANYVLNGPFKLGEPAIAKKTEESYYYAKHILKGEFPLGEPAIAKDMDFSYEYAMLINRRFELGELQIAKERNFAKAYTQEVLKKDFILNGKLICKYKG